MSSFRKPKRTGSAPSPSQYLHVAGLGDRLGHTKSGVLTMMNAVLVRSNKDSNTHPEIQAEYIHLIKGASYVFLELQDVNNATCVLTSLHRQSVEDCDAKQRVLVATFAELRTPATESLDFIESCPSLFSSEPRPQGMSLVQDFISAQEEEALLSEINEQAWDSNTLARRVQHFGYTFSYGLRGIDFQATAPPLPAVFQALVARMVERGLVPRSLEPNQCTVNEYLPGQGISRHVDTHSAFDEVLLSLSLQAPVVMDFREQPRPRHLSKEGGIGVSSAGDGMKSSVVIRQTHLLPPANNCEQRVEGVGCVRVDGSVRLQKEASSPPPNAVSSHSSLIEKQSKDDDTSAPCTPEDIAHEDPARRSLVWLPPRSLISLQGDARYRWSHSIAPRKFDRVDKELLRRTGTRVSLTFRKVFIPVARDPPADSNAAGGRSEADGPVQYQMRPCPCGDPACVTF